MSFILRWNLSYHIDNKGHHCKLSDDNDLKVGLKEVTTVEALSEK